MPAEQIARNLAFINWTVLAGLGLGSFAAVVVARLRTEAPRGYLAFTALCAAGFGVLAWLSDGALPAAPVGATAASDPALDQVRRLGLLLLSLVAAAWALGVRRGGRMPVLGAAVFFRFATVRDLAIELGAGVELSLVRQWFALDRVTVLDSGLVRLAGSVAFVVQVD